MRLAYNAWAYVWLGEPEAALSCTEQGLRIGRFSANSTPLRGAAAIACVEAGRYEAALAHVKEGMLLTQNYTSFYKSAAAALAQLGRMEEAQAELAKSLALLPDDSISGMRARSGYQDNAATRRLFDGLRLAGLPE
jgi:tetratricopeptide (TPR) repeat protein